MGVALPMVRAGEGSGETWKGEPSVAALRVGTGEGGGGGAAAPMRGDLTKADLWEEDMLKGALADDEVEPAMPLVTVPLLLLLLPWAPVACWRATCRRAISALNWWRSLRMSWRSWVELSECMLLSETLGDGVNGCPACPGVCMWAWGAGTRGVPPRLSRLPLVPTELAVPGVRRSPVTTGDG